MTAKPSTLQPACAVLTAGVGNEGVSAHAIQQLLESATPTPMLPPNGTGQLRTCHETGAAVTIGMQQSATSPPTFAPEWQRLPQPQQIQHILPSPACATGRARPSVVSAEHVSASTPSEQSVLLCGLPQCSVQQARQVEERYPQHNQT